MKKEFDFNTGEILLVDKDLDWTSFQAVKKIKYLFKIKKIGHGGTLDPLATGLLVMGTGKKTKELEGIMGSEKVYTGTITLGGTTASYDLEEEIDQTYDISHITEEMIYNTAQSFIGEQLQYPPIFSAVKVDGKRAYKAARAGEKIEIKPRTIHIFDLKITKIDIPNIDFEVHVSKGTYIRSLAHDFGKAMNSGSHLSKLRRTKVGNFSIEDAYSINDLIELKEKLNSEGN